MKKEKQPKEKGRFKKFIKNLFSGDYDHATQSMNEFLATGKFPDEAKLEEPKYVVKDNVVIPEQVMDTGMDDLNRRKEEALRKAAELKRIKAQIENK